MNDNKDYLAFARGLYADGGSDAAAGWAIAAALIAIAERMPANQITIHLDVPAKDANAMAEQMRAEFDKLSKLNTYGQDVERDG